MRFSAFRLSNEPAQTSAACIYFELISLPKFLQQHLVRFIYVFSNCLCLNALIHHFDNIRYEAQYCARPLSPSLAEALLSQIIFCLRRNLKALNRVWNTHYIGKLQYNSVNNFLLVLHFLFVQYLYIKCQASQNKCLINIKIIIFLFKFTFLPYWFTFRHFRYFC